MEKYPGSTCLKIDIRLQNVTFYRTNSLQLNHHCISQLFNNLGTVIRHRASWFPGNLLQPIINGFIHFQVVLTTASLLALQMNLSVSKAAPSWGGSPDSLILHHVFCTDWTYIFWFCSSSSFKRNNTAWLLQQGLLKGKGGVGNHH